MIPVVSSPLHDNADARLQDAPCRRVLTRGFSGTSLCQLFLLDDTSQHGAYVVHLWHMPSLSDLTIVKAFFSFFGS